LEGIIYFLGITGSRKELEKLLVSKKPENAKIMFPRDKRRRM
jgi:hypothetical protein